MKSKLTKKIDKLCRAKGYPARKLNFDEYIEVLTIAHNSTYRQKSKSA